MNYLSRDQILLIHSMIVDETGGSHGVRDHHVILSLEAASRQGVFGRELFPTVFEKAAVYARNIIMGHPFVDGNKRTGMTAAAVFLENNNYAIKIKEGGIEQLALEIVTDKLSIKEISSWLKKHSRKVKK